MSSAAIFGIGNVLLGDDGVGPAVARYLAGHYELGPDIVVEDLGTPSLDLPGYLADHETVVFVDAVASDQPPGTILTFTREQLVSVPAGTHAHEISIPDALRVLEFAGYGPRHVTLIGVVPSTLEGGVQLSEAVAAAVPGAALKALGYVKSRISNFEFRTSN